MSKQDRSFDHYLQRIHVKRPLEADLSTGDPLPLPPVQEQIKRIVPTLREYAGAQIHRYDDSDGVPELKEALSNFFTTHFQRSVSSQNIVVTPGVQLALRYLQALDHQHGHRPLFPSPIEFPGLYSNHRGLVPEIGREFPLHQREWRSSPFTPARLNWEGVDQVLLTHPHSPTGRLWPERAVKDLSTYARKKGAIVILDKTCALPFASLTATTPPAVDEENIVHLFSFSKVGLAGERVGFAIASEDVAAALRAQQRLHIIQSPKLGQWLALKLMEFYLENPDVGALVGSRLQLRATFAQDLLSGACEKLPQLSIAPWQGGPFCWIQWDNGPADVDVFDHLLRSGVAVIPGHALRHPCAQGEAPLPQGLRIAITRDLGTLERGLTLIAKGLKHLLARPSERS